MPVFNPSDYYNAAPSTRPTTRPYGSLDAVTDSTNTPAFSSPYAQYPTVTTPTIDDLTSPVHGSSPALSTPLTLTESGTKKPTKHRQRYTMPKLQGFVELDALLWEQFVEDARAFVKDSQHPERLKAVAGTNLGVVREVADKRMDKIVDEFLEQNGNGIKYFARGLDNTGAAPRTWYWPDDKEKARKAIGPSFKRFINEVRTPKAPYVKMADRIAPATGRSPLPSPAASTTSATRVNFAAMRNGMYQRVLQRMDHAVTDVSSYAGVLAQVEKALKQPYVIKLWAGAEGADVYTAEMYVHGPNGLIPIKNAEDWEDAVAVVRATWWMNNELTIVFLFDSE